MRKILFAAPMLLLGAAFLSPAPVLAQGATQATVVGTCGTPPNTYVAGTNRNITQGTDGKLCDQGSGSGGITTYTTTDKGGTITSGGAAQNAIASNASRKIWCIQNDPDATEVLSVRVNGTASATSGIILQPGVQACSQAGALDTAAVSVFAATTDHRWLGFEGQ